MSASQYTPFRADFPGFALIDALSVVKDGAANSPAGRLQLAHSAFDLVSWALHSTLEANVSGTFFAEDPDPLTDDEAVELLEQVQSPSEENSILVGSVACPISPATALKLAGWLLKVAEVVLPVIL